MEQVLDEYVVVPLLGNRDYVTGQISDLGTLFVAVYFLVLVNLLSQLFSFSCLCLIVV